MLQLVFFVFLFSTSTRLVDGLICATNCDYSSNINAVTVPSCNFVNRPNAEHSCQVRLAIDYFSGEILARLDARTPPQAFTYDAATVFSLYDESSSLSIEFDCSTTDKCDLSFVNDLLAGDWIKVQTQVKTLRKFLADILFNSTDLRPTETCPANQPCSGQGFCKIFYQAWSDAERPTLQSTCANSTVQPRIEWIQAYDQTKTGQLMDYTCNIPECASTITTDSVIRAIERDYILPVNVTIPSQITTTTLSPTQPISSSSSTTQPTTPLSTPISSSTTPSSSTTEPQTTQPPTTTPISTAAPATKSAGRSFHLDRSEKMIFAFIFLLFVCLF